MAIAGLFQAEVTPSWLRVVPPERERCQAATMPSRPVFVSGWLIRSLLGRMVYGRLFRSLRCWNPDPSADGGMGAPQLTYFLPAAVMTVV